ncbi:hypothetical protein [Burkholderia gladioli]|uniref:hypothetical protein n=1 Tax=Burkholderia gladioli TaxID=28095 RepID=UPI001641A5BC|nr:hypothetical protein [Burkholderia gladioli]
MTVPADLSPAAFDALRALMNRARFARSPNTVRLAQLRRDVEADGFPREVVDEAVNFWAAYEKQKRRPS